MPQCNKGVHTIILINLLLKACTYKHEFILQCRHENAYYTNGLENNGIGHGTTHRRNPHAYRRTEYAASSGA